MSLLGSDTGALHPRPTLQPHLCQAHLWGVQPTSSQSRRGRRLKKRLQFYVLTFCRTYCLVTQTTQSSTSTAWLGGRAEGRVCGGHTLTVGMSVLVACALQGPSDLWGRLRNVVSQRENRGSAGPYTMSCSIEALPDNQHCPGHGCRCSGGSSGLPSGQKCRLGPGRRLGCQKVLQMGM